MTTHLEEVDGIMCRLGLDPIPKNGDIDDIYKWYCLIALKLRNRNEDMIDLARSWRWSSMPPSRTACASDLYGLLSKWINS